MKVVLASKNNPKKQAVTDAFAKVFAGETIEIVGVKASSGVSDHPTTGPESMTGAMNRVKHARELEPGADYYVGIEGGLLKVDDLTWELGWVVVMNDKGEFHTAPSSGVEMSGELLQAIHSGIEGSRALEEKFGIKNIGDANGMYGLVTDDRVTRAASYEQAVIFALAPFKHPEYFS